MPIELGLGTWRQQLRHVAAFDGDAKAYGHFLVDRCRDVVGSMHVRRLTDVETATPFDCFHYRIIYQTFHGMRDVLANLAGDADTAVWPFQYRRDRPRRVVVESCPSSTLKRLSLPHQNYKQSGGRPLEEKHRRTRREILRGLRSMVDVSPYQRGVIMNDPGGDALDAVIAAVGGYHGYRHADHDAIARHPRYPREGFVYA